MVTTSWTIVCVDVVKKWWTTMSSSLESDLRELRSLQMATTSLSEDSRSIRYESNQSQAVSTSILAPSYDCNSMAAKTFINDRIVDLPLCGSRTLSQVQAERVQGAEGQSRYVRPVGSGTLGAGALGPRFQTALLPLTSRPDYTAVRHRRTRERLYLSNLYLTI
ncbi:uncharacterized protein isoform X2 [Rhodnius prolixus]|uniref:Uncharacterized protein n=1 Tax=Rhodnius prolixus TaxID=13249 RepID=T1HZ93_RHOPR